MKFKLFSTSKSKGENKPPKSKAAASKIAELEEHLNDWTDNLKQTEKKIQKSSRKASEAVEDTPTHPHGPIKELSLESEDNLDDNRGATEEDLEDVNMIEVQGEAEPPPEGEAASGIDAPPEHKPEESGLGGDSFKQLFVNEDDEDNPLANLIQSLPEVTINELEDDLKEIKDIIKDWQRK
jgi:hypothetical protein